MCIRDRRDNLRKVGNVSCRSLWTPDVDNATPEFVAALKDKLTFKCAVYSTHSHTPEAPRLRIVAPFTRDVTADEFMAISRFMAAELGIDMFDAVSYTHLDVYKRQTISSFQPVLFVHTIGTAYGQMLDSFKVKHFAIRSKK